jgi:hypothetical protein
MVKRLEHVDAAKAEAERLGATFEMERCRRHIRAILSLNGKQRKVFLSISPSDHRVIMNIREDVRKKVREMQNA